MLFEHLLKNPSSFFIGTIDLENFKAQDQSNREIYNLNPPNAFNQRLLHTARYCKTNSISHTYRWIVDLNPNDLDTLFVRPVAMKLKESNTIEFKIQPRQIQRVDRLYPFLQAQLADSLQDVVLLSEAEPTKDPGPRVLYVNRTFEKMTGYRNFEIIGKNPRMLQGPDTSPHERQRIRDALKNWEPVTAEMVNYKKDGTLFYVELKIAPICDETGWWTHWIGIQRDITDRKIKENIKNTERITSTTEAFSSGIAHDLNNKISLISNQMALHCKHIKEASMPQAELLEEATQINRNIISLKSITKQFFSVNRPKQDSVYIEDLNEEILKILKFAIGSKNIELHFKSHLAPGFYGQIKLICLEQVLSNLIVNSLEAFVSEQKGIQNKITVEVESNYQHDENRNYITILVSDNGPGIPLKIKESLFSPYLTSKPDGNGFGLYFSQINMREMGGHLSLINSTNTGTSFELGFPMQMSALQESDKKPDYTKITNDFPILFIDDEKELADTFSELLECESLKCDVAYTADQAIEKICNNNYSLILTDLNLEGVFKTDQIILTAKNKNQKQPVILISGGDALQDNRIQDVIQKYPEIPIWTKPFAVEEIINLFSSRVNH